MSDRLADVYQFDLRNSIAYVFSNQFRVIPNDIVYVSTTGLGRLNRVIDQVTPGAGPRHPSPTPQRRA